MGALRFIVAQKPELFVEVPFEEIAASPFPALDKAKNALCDLVEKHAADFETHRIDLLFEGRFPKDMEMVIEDENAMTQRKNEAVRNMLRRGPEDEGGDGMVTLCVNMANPVRWALEGARENLQKAREGSGDE